MLKIARRTSQWRRRSATTRTPPWRFNRGHHVVSPIKPHRKAQGDNITLDGMRTRGQVLRMRFGSDMTQTHAEESQHSWEPRAHRQIEAKALRKMRDPPAASAPPRLIENRRRGASAATRYFSVLKRSRDTRCGEPLLPKSPAQERFIERNCGRPLPARPAVVRRKCRHRGPPEGDHAQYFSMFCVTHNGRIVRGDEAPLQVRLWL